MTTDTFAMLPNWLGRRRDVSATDKLLYARLHQYQGHNANSWPSLSTLAAEIGIDRSGVIDHVHNLERHGLLKVERKPGIGNRYTVRVPPEVRTSGENATSGVSATSGESTTPPVVKTPPQLVVKTPPKEINEERNKRSSIPRRTSARWTKPELPELEAYAQEIGLPVTEVAAFVDHYNSNGWKVGRSPMKDWQAALRNWKRNHDKWGGNKTHGTNNRNAGTYNDGKAEAYANAAR